MLNSDSRCPRCGEGRLQGWAELGAEEREVVLRLPASADYSLAERQARHHWCAKCWFEATDQATQNV